MSCPNQPTHVTHCPLCRLPISATDVAGSPADEYPTHYACRVAQQEFQEGLEDEDFAADYRGRELDQIRDRDESEE